MSSLDNRESIREAALPLGEARPPLAVVPEPPAAAARQSCSKHHGDASPVGWVTGCKMQGKQPTRQR